MSYRFLIVNTDYGHFLEQLYQKNPGLSTKLFAEQRSARMQTLFGVNDFYSANLKKLGHEATDLIYNNRLQQHAWAVENGLDVKFNVPDSVSLLRSKLAEVFKAQVRMLRPDVIVNLAMETVDSRILSQIKSEVRFIIGQHAAPLTATMEDLSAYDLLLSSIPSYVDYFRAKGKESKYFKLGFESSILDSIASKEDRPIDIAFVGGFSQHHLGGAELFNHLAKEGFSMALYGYGAESLCPEARRFFGGGLYGRQMYELYSKAKLVVNRHIDISGEFANNMRLYEATGCGTLLITDSKRNLNTLFDTNTECAAYESKEQCTELARYYLGNERERKRIAANGQQRTLTEHTYSNRMTELSVLVDEYLNSGISSAKRLFEPLESQRLNSGDRHNNVSLEPVSRTFGLDRGIPIDRYYIENFLKENASLIRGRVLEIGSNTYTQKYGTNVTCSDVLNVTDSKQATIVGNLETGENIPQAAFDCIILTQTIQMIYDAKEALRNAVRALKPGGTLLITAAGISQISRYDMDRWGEYWRFTDKSLRMLLAEFVGQENIHVTTYGNVAVAKALLEGRAVHELDRQVLDYSDNDYQVVLTASACKPAAKTCIRSAGEKHQERRPEFRDPLVLLYHRVADDPIDAQLLCVSPANFDRHLKELAENYRVVPLRQLLDEADKGNSQPNTVAITFDDGYQDNLNNALPLLERYGLPATIFVTSGMVGSDREFWWDAMERIFLATSSLPNTLAMSDSQGILRWDLIDFKDRIKVYDQLCQMLRVQPVTKINQIVEQLLMWAGLDFSGRATHRVIDSKGLAELGSHPLIEIGSHTVSHAKLSSLSLDEQLYEITESRLQLEAMTKKSVELFSYPYGAAGDFTRDTVRIVAQAGYRAGIANIQGSVASPVDMYAVPRRLVRNFSSDVFAQWLVEDIKERLEAKTVSARTERILRCISAQGPNTTRTVCVQQSQGMDLK